MVQKRHCNIHGDYFVDRGAGCSQCYGEQEEKKRVRKEAQLSREMDREEARSRRLAKERESQQPVNVQELRHFLYMQRLERERRVESGNVVYNAVLQETEVGKAVREQQLRATITEREDREREAVEASELLEQQKRVERLHKQFVRSIWKLLFTLLAIGGICYAAYLTVKLVLALAPVILLLIIIA